jgi:hypothetical protein
MKRNRPADPPFDDPLAPLIAGFLFLLVVLWSVVIWYAVEIYWAKAGAL